MAMTATATVSFRTTPDLKERVSVLAKKPVVPRVSIITFF